MSYLKHVIVDELIGLGPNDSAVAGGYSPTYEIVDFVYEGAPFDPSNLPNNDLEVVTKSTTTGSTVLGSVLTGTPATFTGGRAPVDGVSQWQRGTDGAWTGITDWAVITEQTTYKTVAADNGLKVRLASKATDADGVVVYGSGNSVGPMEPQAIAVSEPTTITNGLFLNPSEVYLHETITMNSAIMIGGYGELTYQYRLQSMDHGTDTWVNLTEYSSTIPTHVVDLSDEGDKLRFQTRATDETGQTKVSNSPVTTVAVSTEIGTLSTTPADPLAADPGEVINFTVSNAGSTEIPDATPMFFWSIRSGPATITSLYNFGPTSQVTINADATSGDSVQVQVTADDPSAIDTPQSTVVTIVVN